jgi:hypothetical protein
MRELGHRFFPLLLMARAFAVNRLSRAFKNLQNLSNLWFILLSRPEASGLFCINHRLRRLYRFLCSFDEIELSQ